MSGQSAESTPSLGAGSADQSQSSRDGSPVRSSRHASAIPQLSRSRKNSQEFSPTRSAVTSTIPSAAAVQRALSAQRPMLQPTGLDGLVEGARSSERQLKTNAPSWPTSPRLKSPPPNPNKSAARATAKRSESEPTPSNTSLKRLATGSHPDQAAAMQVPENQETSSQHTMLRVPGRGASAGGSALETVAESSVPTTPSIGPVQNLPDQKIDVPILDKQQEPGADSSASKDGEGSGGDVSSKPGASKAENGRSRAPSGSRHASDLAKRSSASLNGPKTKSTTEPPRTMTVETETVTSMPQLLGPDRGASGRDGNGSVRTKPSTETIRPRKEKKKSSRKPASLHAGTVTSKADLFEAKVASAVDEADTSDSDETFVYESNPPDNRPTRHHSRTPSATSLASQEQYGARSKHGVRSGSHAIADSPFTQSNKPSSPRASASNLARLSRPNSPRLANGRLAGTARKGEPYDTYDDAADDERAPLIGSVRVNRTRYSRRPHSASFRQLDYSDDYDRSYCGRYGGCVFLGFVVLLICVGIATFVMALNRPLLDVSIKHIQNVLASEQEIMLDLHVEATNPNLFAITVNELDINLFAESAYVSSGAEWREENGKLRWVSRRGPSTLDLMWPPWHSDDGVDEGTDPIDDPEPGTQKMLLGRILEFDSPLVFDASPLRRSHTSSVGEIRLAKPGNKTEEGGSARWERVLQHQFDLIVRGVVKYQLPLSSKTRSAKVGSRIKVLPDDDTGDQPDDGPQPTKAPADVGPQVGFTT
ncbi:Vacuolar inheritance and morphology protein [Exophiala xenobiotica]|uniref:Vacuolar inheritance and morphology protein n=1 Tax=Vermiconidia calcicola TaxID=1690605 RepID=A0AAV9Q939_9PEZI|nr:Vacuolar inheritance and morphology protein [Exophiala xenobiotica]KAK5536675.1 Vacuolar inheritance and morphology protein [Vermiconidia calcicola]KAK5272516.1 Vacuolar inheritance and morphology protein [Exophiala xenobiotica]KAK5306217.1 Vacuolar inheritance and morphology protein [Exophiala xenobiotica]KAK5341803.1 Vacuolar inheritance and morphology protein [Exophiala xenobiotica]